MAKVEIWQRKLDFLRRREEEEMLSFHHDQHKPWHFRQMQPKDWPWLVVTSRPTREIYDFGYLN